MFESCLEIRDHFSDYVDGVCSPEARLSIRYHLQYCFSCQKELELTECLEEELRLLPRLQVPAEADLQLRVRVSQELNRNVLGRLLVRWDNRLRRFLLPATGGVVAAIFCFCLLMGVETVPANHFPDVPLSFVTPPHVVALAPLDFNTGDTPVVVVTYISADGQVIRYQVLSGQRSPELMRHLDRLIYFSRFTPATTFGRPTEGKIILALREITVRG